MIEKCSAHRPCGENPAKSDAKVLNQCQIVSRLPNRDHKFHPVVPGSPMWYEDAVRRPADSGRQRALSGYSDQRVSIVASGPKGRRTVNGMPTGGSRHPKTGNPAPFQISPPPPPYMLMNLGQRDEP